MVPTLIFFKKKLIIGLAKKKKKIKLLYMDSSVRVQLIIFKLFT